MQPCTVLRHGCHDIAHHEPTPARVGLTVGLDLRLAAETGRRLFAATGVGVRSPRRALFPPYERSRPGQIALRVRLRGRHQEHGRMRTRIGRRRHRLVPP